MRQFLHCSPNFPRKMHRPLQQGSCPCLCMCLCVIKSIIDRKWNSYPICLVSRNCQLQAWPILKLKKEESLQWAHSLQILYNINKPSFALFEFKIKTPPSLASPSSHSGTFLDFQETMHIIYRFFHKFNYSLPISSISYSISNWPIYPQT